MIGKEKNTLLHSAGGKDVSKPPPQYAFRYPCFRAELSDIRCSQLEASMSPPAFDPFGEPVPSTEPVAAPKSPSKRLEQAGVGLFWGLVGIIVLARALYFEPGAFSFGGALAWAQGLVARF